MSDTSSLNLQVGLAELRLGEARRVGGDRRFTIVKVALRLIYFVGITLIPIEILTITTTEQTADHEAFTVFNIRCRTGADIGIP